MDEQTLLYSETTRHLANDASAQNFVTRQNLELSRFTAYGFVLLIGSVAIWVAFEVYNVYRNYKDFIQCVDAVPVKTSTGKISGLWLALCIQYDWLNNAFGYSQNRGFSYAAWMLFYNSNFRDQLQSITPFGQTFNQTFSVALTAALDAAALNPISTPLFIACTASKATAGGKNAQDCFAPCLLSTNFGQTSSVLGGLQGAMSAGGSMAGLAMMGGTALGPVGLLAVGGVAVIGGIVGAFTASKRKDEALKQCEKQDENCYKPPNFPPCSKQI